MKLYQKFGLSQLTSRTYVFTLLTWNGNVAKWLYSTLYSQLLSFDSILRCNYNHSILIVIHLPLCTGCLDQPSLQNTDSCTCIRVHSKFQFLQAKKKWHRTENDTSARQFLRRIFRNRLHFFHNWEKLELTSIDWLHNKSEVTKLLNQPLNKVSPEKRTFFPPLDSTKKHKWPFKKEIRV